MTDPHSDLIENVKKVLFLDWDPILLQDIPADVREANKEEYDRYAGPIAQMIIDGKELSVLREHLLNLEIRIAGKKLDNSRTLVAAQRLFDLESRFSPRIGVAH